MRIKGVGVTRYITELGYVTAPEGDSIAATLRDCIDMDAGRKMVQKASADHAKRLQKLYGGSECAYVPFNPHHAIQRIKVSVDDGMNSYSIGIGSGFTSACVRGDYSQGENFVMTADLGTGWVVDPAVEPSGMPRSTDYGGVVELAVFAIVNSGVGTFIGTTSLQIDENAAVDTPYPGGKMVIGLSGSTDQVIVGIDAGDELSVEYVRDNKVIYQRNGLGYKGTTHLSLGVAIGSIAAVLARVAALDAAATPKNAKKAA